METSAPSNIALIKYMGKISEAKSKNEPTNASLSYTLDHLRTTIRLSKSSEDAWSPLVGKDFFPLYLNEKGKNKFLNYWKFLKEEFGIEENFLIQSANNFPSDAGLASSASSFAALTKAAAQLAQSSKSTEELSVLSRKGSGSSCRSFFTPWALWMKEGAQPIDIPYSHFHHAVLIFDQSQKKVSSSEAHLRVSSSPLFLKDERGFSRTQRAHSRLENLIQSLRASDWKSSYKIVWDEFWDMHELFHTSKESFTYLTEESRQTLSRMKSRWDQEKQGPLITLDAGPNIHLLFQTSQLDLAKDWLHEFAPPNLMTLTSWGKKP